MNVVKASSRQAVLDRHRAPQMSMRLTDRLTEREDVERLRKRYAELTSIAAGLIKECWRLQTDNDDLRGSSKAWMNLYVRQLERANALEQQLLSGPRRV